MVLRLCLLCCVLLLGAEPVEAQRPRLLQKGQKAYKPKMERFEAVGTLDKKNPGGILITTNSRQKWVIGVTPKTKITFTGKAKPAFLRPGMFVALKALVDSKGKATEKIEKLSVFTPSSKKVPGLYPEGPTPEPAKGRSGNRKPPEPTLFEVRGKLIAYNPRDRRFRVLTPRGTVEGEFSENAKITVEITDPTFAAPGDKVEVKGKMLPNVPGRALATSLKIKAARTLGEDKDNFPPNRSKRKRTPRGPKTKKTDNAEGLPVPADDK